MAACLRQLALNHTVYQLTVLPEKKRVRCIEGFISTVAAQQGLLRSYINSGTFHLAVNFPSLCVDFTPVFRDVSLELMRLGDPTVRAKYDELVTGLNNTELPGFHLLLVATYAYLIQNPSRAGIVPTKYHVETDVAVYEHELPVILEAIRAAPAHRQNLLHDFVATLSDVRALNFLRELLEVLPSPVESPFSPLPPVDPMASLHFEDRMASSQAIGAMVAEWRCSGSSLE